MKKVLIVMLLCILHVFLFSEDNVYFGDSWGFAFFPPEDWETNKSRLKLTDNLTQILHMQKGTNTIIINVVSFDKIMQGYSLKSL